MVTSMCEVSLDIFMDLLSDRKIVCFGAGSALHSFVWTLYCYHIENNIEYVVDNSFNMQGKFLSLNERMILVHEPQYLCGNVREDFIIVITCNAYKEVLKQLREYHLQERALIIWYKTILDDFRKKGLASLKVPLSFRRATYPIIPPKIHYCWFGKGKMPDNFLKYIEGWKEMCPDYKIVKWSEDNYNVENHPYMRAAYIEENFGFVSDYARLDIVYNEGGIYLDVDVELVKPLDDLRYQDGYVGMQRNGLISSGLGFGARKGLEIIKEMRDIYDTLEYIPFKTNEERWIKNCKLCPDIMTDIACKYGFNRNPYQYQEFAQLAVFPAEVLDPDLENKSHVSDCTYSIHHYAGSWL